MASLRTKPVDPATSSLQSSFDQKYVHHTLSESKREIRLLNLLPAADKHALLACTIQVFSLNEELPDYNAVSYTWGEFVGYEHEILVSERSFNITSTLAQALRHFRDRDHPRRLWIDAICINMRDSMEHASQVRAAGSIFSTARNVIVWLGEPIGDIEALKVIHEDVGDVYESQDLAVLKAFACHFVHPWFSRVWPLQEYVVARSAVFQWGVFSVDAVALEKKVERIWTAVNNVQHWSADLQEDIDEVRKALSGIKYFNWVRNRYQRDPLDDAAFALVLVTAQELRASDERDKIFALLFLAPPTIRNTLSPDYTVPLTKLYQQLAGAMSVMERVLDIFKRIGEQYLAGVSISPTPDWLPTWIDNISVRVINLWRTNSSEYSEAVVEALAIFADFNHRDGNLVSRQIADRPLSLRDKKTYRDIMRKAAMLLQELMSQTAMPTKSFQHEARTTSAGHSFIVTDRITEHLLSHGFLQRLLIEAARLEPRDDILELRLRPCIRYLGHGLDEVASNLEEFSAALEIKENASSIVRTMVTLVRRDVRLIRHTSDTQIVDSGVMTKQSSKFMRETASRLLRYEVSRLRREQKSDMREKKSEIIRQQISKVMQERTSRVMALLDGRTQKYHSCLGDVSNDLEQLLVQTLVGANDGKAIKPSMQDEVVGKDLSMIALEKLMLFLATESVFVPFLHLVSRIVYSSPLDLVEAEVNNPYPLELLSMLHCESLPVKFVVDWDMADFLKRECADAEPGTAFSRFLSLLVISGTAKSPYATNVETYTKWRWPKTGGYLLDSLKVCMQTVLGGTAFLEPDREISYPKLPYSEKLNSRCEGRMLIVEPWYDRKDGPFTSELITEIGQQLAWLTAACRQAKAKRFSLSQVLFFRDDSEIGEMSFHISGLPLKDVEQQEDACWMPLFLGTVIAHDYPIPPRENKIGIELPFDLMATLAGPLYPLKFGGILCLKAYSRILVPTSVSHGTDLQVQWHYESKPGVRLVPPWRQDSGLNWEKIKTVDTRSLVEARTFLGYCRKVVVDLGTKRPVESHRDILYSGLHDEDHALGIGMPNITVSTGGMLPVTLSASSPVVRQKAQALITDIERNYSDVLYEAKDRPVILYDSNGSDRAWMVPLSCVLLHMVHTWSAKRGTLTDECPHTALLPNSGAAASDVLLRNWNYVVRKTFSPELEKDKLVRDLVMQFWTDICRKQFQDLLTMTQADYSYELQTEKLYGWEYMEIVDGKNSRRKELAFKTNWGLFKQECIVLFAKNLGDVIRPGQDVRVCSKWEPIREHRQYLCATIECLTMLAYQNGGDPETLTTYRLTNKGYWHYKPKDLFIDCGSCGEHSCAKRPQYLHSKPPQDNQYLVPPSEGAVVFGRQLLERSQPSATVVAETSRSSSKRPHHLSLAARAKKRVTNQLERITSGSTTTSSQQGSSDPLLVSEDSSEDS